MADIDARGEVLRGRHSPNILILTCFLAVGIEIFSMATIYQAIPNIAEQFRVAPNLLAWAVAIQSVIGAVTAGIGGRLGDMFGRRRVALISLGAMVIGSLFLLFAQNYAMVLIGRGIEGFVGPILPLSIGILRYHLQHSPKKVNFGAGVAATGGLFFGGAAGVCAGYIIDGWGWRYVFLVTALLNLIITAMMLITVKPDKPSGREPVDWLGALLFAPALVLIMLVISQPGMFVWGRPASYVSLIVGLLIAAGWVLHELRHKTPFFDLRLWGHRPLLAGALITVVMALGPNAQGTIANMFFRYPTPGLMLSARTTGWLMLVAFSLTSLLVGFFTGKLALRYGVKFITLVSMLLFLVGFTLLTFVHNSPVLATTWLAISGFATGLWYPAIPLLVVQTVPVARQSETQGMIAVILNTFLALGPIIHLRLANTSTTMIPLPNGGEMPIPTNTGWSLGIAFIAIMALVGAVLTIVLMPGKGKVAPITGYEPPAVVTGEASVEAA